MPAEDQGLVLCLTFMRGARAPGFFLHLFFLALAFVPALSCDYLIWRARTDIASIDWVSEDTVLQLLLHYEERNPWKIAYGTTDKRNFRTEARMILVRGQNLEEMSTRGTIRGSPVGHAYMFGGSPVFIIAEGEGAGWKTWLVRLSERGMEKIGGLSGENTLRFLPSPDRTRALLLLDQGRAGSSIVLTRDDFSQDLECAAGGRLATQAGDDFTWAADSRSIFIQRGDAVWSWKGCGALERTTRFPRCFLPATSHEGRLSESGVEWMQTVLEERPVLLPREGWKPFGQRESISNPAEIGKGCP